MGDILDQNVQVSFPELLDWPYHKLLWKMVFVEIIYSFSPPLLDYIHNKILFFSELSQVKSSQYIGFAFNFFLSKYVKNTKKEHS